MNLENPSEVKDDEKEEKLQEEKSYCCQHYCYGNRGAFPDPLVPGL